MMMKMESSSCTEDRIQHVLERCLCGLGIDTPDKQLWNAGLCINRWCLEELVKRHPDNFLILLQKILKKTKEVLEECRYELVVPLTLLFSSTLLKAPHVAADLVLLQEAYLLFHSFLTWPEPCSSASKRLLNVLQQELRAPGISFQRLVQSEQGISPEIHHSKTMTVLLVGPLEDVPPEVRSVSDQLISSQDSCRDVSVLLILHAFQAALGSNQKLQTLRCALQSKRPGELEYLMETVNNLMENAASTADLSTARTTLIQSMERLGESITSPPEGCTETGNVETLVLPSPKCHTCSWENDNFDFLNSLLDSDMDSAADCFLEAEIDEEDKNDTSVDEEDEAEGNKEVDFLNNRVESDFSEDITHEDAPEGPPKLRKKPKKKSRSILGVERFSSFFKTPRSPGSCRRVQSMGNRVDFTKDAQRNGSQLKHPTFLSKHPDPLSPRKHVCVRRRPILSCYEGVVEEVPTLVRVVVFGGDKEAGRLARAYSDLQQKESKCPRLTKTCKLQFYLVPTRGRTTGSAGGGNTSTEGPTGSSKSAASVECNGGVLEDSTDIAHMLGLMDSWYERNVLSLLSLSSEVLCQPACKEVSSTENLLTDMVLYYCRHADQPVLLQLYQAELTLAGGDRRREVFLHSLELGHSAGIRAVKAMGAASKRFGIDKEREAVPLDLRVGYNKVAVSGRSQWTQTEMVCTSINLYKACRKPEQLDTRIESLQLTMTEVLKSSKSKKGYNQHICVSEVKVDKVQVHGREDGTTFAVCLDQDEKKFIQSVTRCEVSLCSKSGSGSDWRSYKPSPADVRPSTLESSLNNNIQALLKETGGQNASQKGMLRWSLQKKLEADPSCSVSLIRLLVKELEKRQEMIQKTQSFTHVIPVLHTLYSVVIKSGVMIPTSLFQTVYDRLMKLLILPSPYSTVARSTMRSIKMEITTPGSLYLRTVTAEQNLRKEHHALQEKVFVLADPAVFSAPLEAAVRAHLEASNFLRDAPTMERNVLQRVLQTGLGMNCQSSRLAQALEALEEPMVEKHFQEVVLAVEKSLKQGAEGRANYLNKLQHIYRDILSASKEERPRLDPGSVRSTAMPFPEINFLLWREEEDLRNLLANLACSNSASVAEEERDKRDSVQSRDSGIVRDLNDCDDAAKSRVRNHSPEISRRNAYKNSSSADKLSLVREKMEACPGSSPLLDENRGRHTARVVVLGDNRVLGRLSKAYHSMRVDPWYNSNINSLGAAISKLAGKQANKSESPAQNHFLLETLCYYLRCGTQPVSLPLYSVKITRSSSEGQSVVEEVFVSHLEADIPEFRHLKEKLSKKTSVWLKKPPIKVFGAVISVSYTKISLSRRQVVDGEAPMICGVVVTSEPAALTSGVNRLTVMFESLNPVYNSTIKTQSISIRTLEHRTLSVLEITPCLDPGCDIGSRRSLVPVVDFSKYLDKALSLPIQTFTGVTV
ncbi:Phosphoinositide 3-kinase regulatory subunit 5 [Dissostichus eleginoides]|uniref:Phosphoinositide 3-kinase regulatory subunit 5 n=1 Tax=Dissostichus eleginoides TaxID=100907 RepID=A0AAD9EY47_DISEL|nr:Phosphoinositide 3-kinase regulatory subunit 5 [Dissostichus eleginoides]